MRLMLFNIAYGTGGARSYPHRILTLHRYLRAPRRHFDQIQQFVRHTRPDILGLVEVDAGSVRTGRRNQVVELSRSLSHFSYATKYGRTSVCRYLPIFRHQGNALLTRDRLDACVHHFCRVGLKRLIVEAEVGGLRLFLVHLALERRVRAEQIAHLGQLIGRPTGPCIVAGDFNAFGGREELDELVASSGLHNPNRRGLPTFPSWQPRRELDYILCSRHIDIRRFRVRDDVRLSDHFPLVLDFHF